MEYLENINGDVAKVLETPTKVIVMFCYKTKFFGSYDAAIQYLYRYGFRF